MWLCLFRCQDGVVRQHQWNQSVVPDTHTHSSITASFEEAPRWKWMITNASLSSKYCCLIVKNKCEAKALKQDSTYHILLWDMTFALLTSEGVLSTSKDSCASPAPECWYLTVSKGLPICNLQNNKVSLLPTWKLQPALLPTLWACSPINHTCLIKDIRYIKHPRCRSSCL